MPYDVMVSIAITTPPYYAPQIVSYVNQIHHAYKGTECAFTLGGIMHTML